MSKIVRRDDTIDKLVAFLGKRDGIDKLVKTFQYVFKLAHWRLLEKDPELAKKCQAFENSCGIARKAFRTGRFLTGFNMLRRNRSPDWKVGALTLFGCSGEMVYFFFDHFTWMSKVGLLDSKLATRFAFISAYGEIVLYSAFMTLDVLVMHRDATREEKLQEKLLRLEEKLPMAPIFKPYNASAGSDDSKALTSPMQDLALQADDIRRAIQEIHSQRVSRSLSIAAQFADLLIALAMVEPRPVWCHPLSLGVSGLVSAWSGWYRLWPA